MIREAYKGGSLQTHQLTSIALPPGCSAKRSRKASQGPTPTRSRPSLGSRDSTCLVLGDLGPEPPPPGRCCVTFTQCLPLSEPGTLVYMKETLTQGRRTDERLKTLFHPRALRRVSARPPGKAQKIFTNSSCRSPPTSNARTRPGGIRYRKWWYSESAITACRGEGTGLKVPQATAALFPAPPTRRDLGTLASPH